MATQSTPIAAEGPSYVAKLSMKSIGCKPAVAVDGKTEKVLVARIIGKATAVGEGEDTRDGRIFEFLKGSFAAMNMVTKEEYRSGKLFLPTGIAEPFELAAKNVPTGTVFAFALDIYAVAANNPIGYSYIAKTLLQQEQDELSDLMTALAAPKSAPQIEAPEPAATAKSKK